MHVVLVWSDPPGNPAAMKQLVNDLDLIVSVGNGDRVFGNTGSYADTSNTVEKVVVTCPSGSTITAIVASSTTLYTATQTFALVANGNVISELAQEVTNPPVFNAGRRPSVPTSSTCKSEEYATAPMKFKNQGFPTSNLALAHFTSQFTASLGMFLGVPDYSIAFMEFKSGPWIGFACASYICSSSGSANPCYLVCF